MHQLEELKNNKFLTKRLVNKLSENMHYEVLKYLNSDELLQIRAIKLGGSNKILRSRIGNYFVSKRINMTENVPISSRKNIGRLQHYFEQTGRNILHFHKNKIGERVLKTFGDLFKKLPDIHELIFSI